MRSKKDFTFSDGGTVKVHELSSADLDAFQRSITEASKSSYEDEGLSSFALSYYPILSACTDNPPSLEVAYKKDPCDLDNWYLLAFQLNSDYQELFGSPKWLEEEIKINGKKIVIKSIRPSVIIRYAQFQQKAKGEAPFEDQTDEEYRRDGYAAAAAASFGKIPTAYEARHELGLKDFTLWHSTVKKIVPEWYGEPTPQPEEITETKKKGEGASGNLEVS